MRAKVYQQIFTNLHVWLLQTIFAGNTCIGLEIPTCVKPTCDHIMGKSSINWADYLRAKSNSLTCSDM